MNALATVLDILAATPVPVPKPSTAPTADPALPAVVKIGPADEWFGPTLVLAISLIVDASVIGKQPTRREVASFIGTYCATLGFISIYGWSDDVQSWFGGSWSWQLTGSALAVLAHIVFGALIVGEGHDWSKRIAAKAGPRVGFGSKDSTAVGRICTKLHVAAAMCACTYVLARGPLAFIPHKIGSTLSAGVAQVIRLLIHGLGG